MVRQRRTGRQSPEICCRISVWPEVRTTSTGRFCGAGRRKLALTHFKGGRRGNASSAKNHGSARSVHVVTPELSVDLVNSRPSPITRLSTAPTSACSPSTCTFTGALMGLRINWRVRSKAIPARYEAMPLMSIPPKMVRSIRARPNLPRRPRRIHCLLVVHPIQALDELRASVPC